MGITSFTVVFLCFTVTNIAVLSYVFNNSKNINKLAKRIELLIEINQRNEG